MTITQTLHLNLRSLFKFATLASLILGVTGTDLLNAEPESKPKPAIELGTPFVDSAILQREMPLPVWGWSKPGTEVTVEFSGQKKSATADKDGKWMLLLDALKASAEPQEMTIREKSGATRTLRDLLVGEVWMASGQSNMQWLASKCDVGQVLQKQIADRVAAGEEKTPVIREAKVTDFFACPHPIEHATGEWSSDAGNMSAIAYAFAYQLYREVGVPIGILNCSFSQTSIQAWTPRVGFADAEDAYTKAIYHKILETDPSTAEHKAAWGKFYQDIEAILAENKTRVAKGEEARNISTSTPGNMNDNRDASWLFNARLNPMIPYAIKGCIWNQGYANMGEGLVYYNNLHSMIRGWRKLWDRPELPVYFNQFYCPGQKDQWDHSPSIGSTSEMRLGTWLARDIPNTGMAIQIDITGAIHYTNKNLTGQRLALHALKKQYGKDVVTDGPMFKSYEVKGDQLVVTLENADGLLIAETGTNSKSGLAVPTVIPNGDDKVKCFYLAGEDRVWHPAKMKISGDKIIVTSPEVNAPRGVSYATGGVGNEANVYNKSLLPATPFIYYDNKLVTSETWSDNPIKIAGVKPDPNAGGLMEECRKIPLLSSQFCDNAVLQADVPVTIWGSAINIWGPRMKGNFVVKFSFDGKEQTIPIGSDVKEWKVTLPPMKAGTETHSICVRLEIDGEFATERSAKNVIFGDVFYVGASSDFKCATTEKPTGIVRMITRKSKGSTASAPRRFSVSTSTSMPEQNRFGSVWEDATGVAAAIGQSLSAGSNRPVGVIFMQTSKEKGSTDATLKEWIAADCLDMAPSLLGDYKELAGIRPGNEYFDANVRRYLDAWKEYWGGYVPEMISTKRVPDAAAWGSYPTLSASITTIASQTHNVLVESFTPATLKGILFLTGSDMTAADQGALFGEQMSALANGMKKRFGGADIPFYFTLPAASLAPKISKPSAIKGCHESLEITNWSSGPAILEWISSVTSKASK